MHFFEFNRLLLSHNSHTNTSVLAINNIPSIAFPLLSTKLSEVESLLQTNTEINQNKRPFMYNLRKVFICYHNTVNYRSKICCYSNG